jgi:hypothetical protein
MSTADTQSYIDKEDAFEKNPQLLLKNYFEPAELNVLKLIKYAPDVWKQLEKDPTQLGFEGTKEEFNSLVEDIGKRYLFYNRPPINPEEDPAPLGVNILSNLRGMRASGPSTTVYDPTQLTRPSTPREPYTPIPPEEVAELQKRGFSGYQEFDDPNRNVLFKGFDFDSLLNMSYYQPRHKTDRDLRFALNTISKRTGVDQGTAYWIDPSKPELGVAVKQGESDKYVAFDLPYFTVRRDIPDFLHTEGLPIIGELIAMRFGRGGAQRIFAKQSMPGGVGKLLEWAGTATSAGFGAALGDLLRLSAGKQMGAHDREWGEIFRESGMSGLLATAGVGVIDGIMRGIPLLKDLFRGSVLPDAFFAELSTGLKAARASAEGIQTRGAVGYGLTKLPDGRIQIEEVGTAVEEVTTKELNEAIQKLLPDAEYVLGKNTNLTLGPASLDEFAADMEILFLKNSSSKELRKIFRGILQGDEDLMQRFLAAVNRQFGAGIDKDISGQNLSSYFKREGRDEIEDLAAASAMAMDNVLNAMGASDVAEGGVQLFKQVPNAQATTKLMERDYTRLREIIDTYLEEPTKAFKEAISDPSYANLTTGAGATRLPAKEWKDVAKNTDSLLRDWEAASARTELFNILGTDGAATLRRLQGLGPAKEGGFVNPEFTLKELNDARLVLNKFIGNTKNTVALDKAINLEHGIENQMYKLLDEGAAREAERLTGKKLTGKKLEEWRQLNSYGFNVTRAWIKQKEAIKKGKLARQIEQARDNPEALVTNLLEGNVPGSPINTKVQNLVYILETTEAPELRALQGSVLARIQNATNALTSKGTAPTGLQRARNYKNYLQENEGTIRAFFPKDDFKSINTLKNFEKNVLGELEKTQTLVEDITTKLGDDNYTNIVKGTLEGGAGFRRAGEFEKQLEFIKPYLEASPLLQKRTASVAKGWLVSKIMKRGPDGIWRLDPEELNRVLYEGFGPEQTGKTFKDVMAPLIGKDGPQYVKNLEYLDLIAQRYATRTAASKAVDEALLMPQTPFIERMIFPPLTQRGRRITAIRNATRMNSGKFVGELLLNPKKLDRAIKLRKSKLNTQQIIRALTALEINAWYDPAQEYSQYDPEIKQYLNTPQGRATDIMVDAIDFFEGAIENGEEE